MNRMFAFLCAAAAQVLAPALAQAADTGALPPELPYKANANALRLPPGVNFGEAAGVGVNSKGHVFVFARGGNIAGDAFGGTAAQLMEFDQDGKFVRMMGQGLYSNAFAHSVRADRDDNIWIIDKGSDLVVRLDQDDHVTLVLGRKQEASDGMKPHSRKPPYQPAIAGYFRQPTNLAWDKAGNIYIADGYVNARVAKFDKDGEWIGSWGDHGTGPSQFNVAHDIAIDANGIVYVADRGNRRIQVFDGNGKYLRSIVIDVPVPPGVQPMIGDPITGSNKPKGSYAAGSPWAMCITPDQTLYVADAYPGRIYRLTLDGKVTGMFGTGGKAQGKFGWIHAMACPTDKVIWIAELVNWRVQKLELQ